VTEQESHFRILYIAMAAVAGSVTALSLLPWKTMSWGEVALTLFVGSSFAAFAVPYLVGEIAGVDLTNLRAACFFTYLGATGANAFLPILIRRAKSALERIFGKEGEA